MRNFSVYVPLHVHNVMTFPRVWSFILVRMRII